MENTPESKALFKVVYDLWENQSDNLTEKYKKNLGYWNGDYKSEIASLQDQTVTACNVVKRVVEVKGNAALDMPFTANVVPVINSFVAISEMQDLHDYADILNDEVQNVLSDNKFDVLKEIQMRRGEIGGLAPTQTNWDTSEVVEGQIKISDIFPKDFRWDKNAVKPNDCTFMAYLIERNPAILKKTYARNPDGSYDLEKCKRIDDVTDNKSVMPKNSPKGVLNVHTDDTASQAYVYDTSGIKSGQSVKLVVMFLLDDSVYAPTEGDNTDVKDMKEFGRLKYPNGRMVVFVPDENKQIVFESKPIPAGFRNLGNIDIFRPVDTGEMVGKSEVDDLIPIQDRINGAYTKLRLLVGSHINTVILPDELKGVVKEGSFISQAITFLTNINLLPGADKKPQVLNNQAIEEAMKLLEYIERLEQEAYRTARINEIMVSGDQPTSVQSGDQVEALQLSPMSSIRSIQRNFKEWVVSVGEKIVSLIQEKYTVQRLIKLSTATDGAEYARFNTVQNGGQSERNIELINRAGQAVRTIKINPDWKFSVQVTAGLDIPRSRTETAALTDKIITSPIMQSGDIDMIDMYLTAQDYPNRRAVVSMLRNKQKQAAENPKQLTLKDVITNPVIGKNAADILSALAKGGFSKAIGQMLQMIGLDGSTDTAADAPIQAIASKADVKDIVAMTPGKISAEPAKDLKGREVAGAIIDNEQTKHQSGVI